MAYNMIIVDDEPIIRKGLKKLVEDIGLPIDDIRLASNGEEALKLIEERLPDFILTDIRMPDIDGLELCRTIREKGVNVGIIVISGFGEFSYAQKCISYGVQEYLLKPIKQNELERALSKLIEAKSASVQDVLSMHEFDSYMDLIVQGIWELKQLALTEALSKWKSYVTSLGMNFPQAARLLKEGMIAIVEQLNFKNIYPFSSENIVKIDEATSVNEAFGEFESQLQCLYAELQNKRRGKTIDPIEAAKEYIDSHLNQEVSLEEVAGYLGLNASYFSQFFKQMTGETFVHYRMKMRMAKAKHLLEFPHHRINTISEWVGYVDYSHFAKTFKKYYGMSPTEYRAKLGID